MFNLINLIDQIRKVTQCHQLSFSGSFVALWSVAVEEKFVYSRKSLINPKSGKVMKKTNNVSCEDEQVIMKEARNAV